MSSEASNASSSRTAPSYSTSLLAGALSGLTVDLLFYPIDTLKTRLQSKQGFLASGGFGGIYRGIGSVAIGSAPGAAAFFVVYEGMKPVLLNANLTSGAFREGGYLGPPALHMAAASSAEVAACLIRVPTEVIKSRQQTSSYGAKTTSLGAFKSVLQENGIRGLYRGFSGTVGREIPFTCIQFPLYEHLKLRMAKSPHFNAQMICSGSNLARGTRSIPTWQAGLAGSIAGAIAAGVTTPLDVVKTRIMLERRTQKTPQEILSSGVNTKILPTLKHIFRNEGTGALFAGFIPRTLWIGFGGAVFLGTFEAGVKMLEVPEG